MRSLTCVVLLFTVFSLTARIDIRETVGNSAGSDMGALTETSATSSKQNLVEWCRRGGFRVVPATSLPRRGGRAGWRRFARALFPAVHNEVRVHGKEAHGGLRQVAPPMSCVRKVRQIRKFAADDGLHTIGRFSAAFLLDVTPDFYEVVGGLGR